MPKLIKTKPIIPRKTEGVSAIKIKYNVNLLFKVLIFFLLTLRNIGNNKVTNEKNNIMIKIEANNI